MPSLKKILILAVVLAGLLATGFSLWKWGRPTSPSENPLKGLDPKLLTKVVMVTRHETITLEQSEGVWRLTTPLKDKANPQIADRILPFLQGMDIGSVVSEKEERYPQFELNPSSATHVLVYKTGQDRPVLDVFVGKPGLSYDEVFVRLEGQRAIRLARNCPSYLFRMRAEEFRPKTDNQKP